MKFYSGFFIENEEPFFQRFIKQSDYCVSGFSYGSILAFEKVLEMVNNHQRVDTLQLFSPAFFQTKSPKFKKLQLYGFTKNKEAYLSSFLKSCFYPYDLQEIEYKEDTKDDLEKLLHYRWNIEELLTLKELGVTIEVYLGGNDVVTDVNNAKEFFMDVATVTSIKEANHFLLTKNDLEDLRC